MVHEVGEASPLKSRATIALPLRNPHTSRRSPPLHSVVCLLMASVFDHTLRRPVASVPLKYSIAAASEHSGAYVASNILRDEPADSTSRWSGASQIPHVKQWVTLRLDNLVVLSSVSTYLLFIVSIADRCIESITFGKVRDLLRPRSLSKPVSFESYRACACADCGIFQFNKREPHIDLDAVHLDLD